MLLVAFICMSLANGIQKDFGNIDISMGKIEIDGGSLTYKLYRPKSTLNNNEVKVPGVLLLHGYQNDHETSGAYAIELAKRGAVVLAIDEYGHGSTSLSMIERGYTNHKVSVNLGEDEDGKSYVEIGGQKRYRVLMNFSDLAFMNDRYSKGSDGSQIFDSSMGGIAAYAYLASLDYVDASKLAVSGHSMGTWASWSVSAAYAGAKDEYRQDITPKATVLQCGELFRNSTFDEKKSLNGSDIYFNNVLLLQAKYDEFSYFRDYKNNVNDELLRSDLRCEFLGTDKQNAAWNTTFGDFSQGSARRMELLNTNHRLTTHNKQGIKTSIEWLNKAIDLPITIPVDSQSAMVKEYLVFIAMLLVIFSLLPLMSLLLDTKVFAYVKQGVPDRKEKEADNKKYWRNTIITILIAGLSYPFMSQLGHGLLPLPENIFRMTIGNGFVSWYLLLIIVMLVTTIISCRKAKKKGQVIDYVDLGLSSEEKVAKKNGIDWKLFAKSLLLVVCLVTYMYIFNFACEKLFMLDLRFIWPFFKSFTLERFIQFLVYISIFALFFILNNSKIFAQNRLPDTDKPGIKAYFKVWWKYALCMVGGVILIALIEYIPFFMGIGPGADVLFTPTFGGPFMSLLIVFGPQVIVFSFICTYAYQKTGSVYTGALLVAFLATWIVTGGSAIL